MTVAVLAGELRSALRPNPLHAFRDAFRAAWEGHRRLRAERIAAASLARLGPRLLADMGIDPESVGAARENWDDLRPNGYLVRRR